MPGVVCSRFSLLCRLIKSAHKQGAASQRLLLLCALQLRPQLVSWHDG